MYAEISAQIGLVGKNFIVKYLSLYTLRSSGIRGCWLGSLYQGFESLHTTCTFLFCWRTKCIKILFVNSHTSSFKYSPSFRHLDYELSDTEVCFLGWSDDNYISSILGTLRSILK